MKDIQSSKLNYKNANHLLFVFLILLLACSNNHNSQKVIGLWELVDVKRDKFDIQYNTTFIDIKSNNSFAISRRTGDLGGLYKINSTKIKLASEDNDWYNTDWSYFCQKDFMFLRGKDNIGRNIQLQFKKIVVIPDFQEFENKIIGKWELYKIRDNASIEKPIKTWFEIATDGSYVIINNDSIIESGKATINTRHKKIIFESEDIIWNAWFYGNELRLDNNNLGLQYSLRKLSTLH